MRQGERYVCTIDKGDRVHNESDRMMRTQRSEIRDGEIPVLTSGCSAVVIEITEPRECEGSTLQTGDGSAVQQVTLEYSLG